MMKAIGYVRRSSDRQDESLPQQQAKLQAYAKDQGWELVQVYSDDAITGSDMQRPGLLQLIDRAKRDKSIGAVITWDRNRLARPKDPVDGLMLERKLLEEGKRLIYVGNGTEASRSFTSGIISYIENYQNGDYLRKLSRDTMRGTSSRAQRGLWPGGPIPFGYDRLILDGDGSPRRIVCDMEDGSQVVIDPASGLVVERVAKGRRFSKQDHEACSLTPSDPVRVRAVERMFADYAAGKPTRYLREQLNLAGFRTSRGSLFTVQTILPILENPAYTGRCVYNRRTLSKWHAYVAGQSVERQQENVERRPESDWITCENAWPALVSPDLFAQVQTMRNASRNQYHQTVGSAIRADYLLGGIFFCGVCGGLMRGQTNTSGKGYRTRYYICGEHHRGRHDKCSRRYTVPAEVVEGHICDLIRRDLAKLRDDDQLHRYIADELRRAMGKDQDAGEQLQRRLADLDQQLAKLRDHIKAMPPATAQGLGLYDEASALVEQRQGVEGQLQKLVTVQPNLPDAAMIRSMATAELDRMAQAMDGGTIEEKRAFIREYIQKIKADPDLQKVEISLYPALFTSKIAGAGFEPATSGL